MTGSINPNTANVFFRVEAQMPPSAEGTSVTTDCPTLEAAVHYARQAREMADAMLAQSEVKARDLGQIKIWRVRSTVHGGRMQLNLIPEEQWLTE